jgi:hypothetical protein
MATIDQIIKNINRTLKNDNISKRMREDLERKKNILSNNKVVEK